MLKGVVADLAVFAVISCNITLMGAGKSAANEDRAGAVSAFEEINRDHWPVCVA